MDESRIFREEIDTRKRIAIEWFDNFSELLWSY